MNKKSLEKEAEKRQKAGKRKKNQKELDAVFPGIGPMRTLAKGIHEEGESPAEVQVKDWEKLKKGSKKSSKSKGEGSENKPDGEVDEFPESWAKIAAKDEETQKKIRQKMEESRQKKESILMELAEKAKKKTKPHCNPKGGNAMHSKSDGRFTSKGKAGSWSIKHPKTSKDCDAGTYRTTGNGNKKVWNKQPCGRDGKYKCGTKDAVKKGYAPTKEELIFRESLTELSNTDPSFYSKLVSFFEENSKRLQTEEAASEKEQKETDYCRKRYGLKTFNDFLKVVDKIERSQKGDLLKPQK